MLAKLIVIGIGCSEIRRASHFNTAGVVIKGAIMSGNRLQGVKHSADDVAIHPKKSSLRWIASSLHSSQ